MSTFVEIQNLRKQYTPPDYAVGSNESGLNLNIHEGEIFSLLGPNGAGKTTTINMISTLLTPTSGSITIGGFDVQKNPVKAKNLIGIVPQDIALYPTLSARQNLDFFGRMYGLGGKQLKIRVDEVLEFIGLAERADDNIETYSGGMKRRVNIGVGLIHKPKMVFLDEPTVGIDPQSRRSILDTVKLLNAEQDMTVLYTTHYMEEAQELSHRIGIIDHGEIIALGTLDELTQRVGEKDTLIFNVTNITAEIQTQLEAIGGVDNMLSVPEKGELHIISNQGSTILSAVINVLNKHDIPLSSIQVEEPNLEAVFLELTGRALRD